MKLLGHESMVTALRQRGTVTENRAAAVQNLLYGLLEQTSRAKSRD
jgi:hypothetical protein